MKHILLAIIALIAFSPLAAQTAYNSNQLTAELLNELESGGTNLEQIPTVLNQDLVPGDLSNTDEFFDRFRPRPKPPVFDQNPPEFNQPAPPEDTRKRFPILRRIWNGIINLPIIVEIRGLFWSLFNWICLLTIWLLPSYIFQLRLAWPVDVVMLGINSLIGLSKNTKKPFE